MKAILTKSYDFLIEGCFQDTVLCLHAYFIASARMPQSSHHKGRVCDSSCQEIRKAFMGAGMFIVSMISEASIIIMYNYSNYIL